MSFSQRLRRQRFTLVDLGFAFAWGNALAVMAAAKVAYWVTVLVCLAGGALWGATSKLIKGRP